MICNAKIPISSCVISFGKLVTYTLVSVLVEEVLLFASALIPMPIYEA